MIGTRSGSTKDTVKVEHGTGRIINERIVHKEPVA